MSHRQKKKAPEGFTEDFKNILNENRYSKDQIRIIKDHFNKILESMDERKVPMACVILCKKLMKYCWSNKYSADVEPHLRVAMKISRIGLFTIFKKDLYGLSYAGLFFYQDYCGELLQIHAYVLFKLNRPFASLRFLDMAEKMFQAYLKQCDDPEKKKMADVRYVKKYYEWCRMQEAEVWYSYFDVIPDKDKPLFISAVTSYFAHSMMFYHSCGDIKSANVAMIQGMAVQLQAEKYGLPKQEDIDDMNRAMPESYEGWCFANVLYINVFNEIPNYIERWAYDENDLGVDEKHSIVYFDVLKSYDHCRKLMYSYTRIDQEKRFQKIRDDDIESVIDCFVRLYSLLDKLARIINHKFSLNVHGDLYFWKVANELKNNDNRYLRAIYDIKADLRPSDEDVCEHNVEPTGFMTDIQNSPAVMRNLIMHSGLKLVEDANDVSDCNDITNITAKDLEIQTMFLLYSVREVILMIKLADVENNKKSKNISEP